MARRSLRLSSDAAPASAHKRNASNADVRPGQTKRTKKTSASPRNRKGTQKDSHHDEDDDQDELDDSSSDEPEDSEFSDDEIESPEDSDEVEEDDSDEEVTPRRKTKPKTNKTPTSSKSTAAGESQLWREGVKAGLGPGTQVIIKRPKARPAGKTPYTDDTIHPNTMLFLEDLKANNDRQWLKMHDPDFRQSERDWHSFVDKITEKLVEIDDTVPELPVKDVIFRIYRDIRFSSDPTPYKPHFSAAWYDRATRHSDASAERVPRSRTGRKGPYAAYYVQISPRESFVGGGLWHPEAAPTAAMRRDIDRHPRRIKDILLDDQIRKEFMGDVAKVDSKATRAFASSNAENALKTKPKGYDADHADIELLRLRNYTIGRKLISSEVMGPGGLDRITHLFAVMKPFITYLNSVVMPDEVESESDGSGSSDEDNAAQDEGEDEDEDAN